ncbi:MAG: hypothetical protein LBT87_00820 [Treponema sp.]|jgi:hypothetical protein|nr:hypothetical protein [Treponema sp.]
MKTRICLLGIILGAALILLPVGADSIVSESTFGLFDDETDTFTDPNDYDGVEFDNAFIFLRGGRNAEGAGDGLGWDTGRTGKTVNGNKAGIAGGFATRIKGLYLGAGFDTSLWDGSQTITNVDGDRVDNPPFDSDWGTANGIAPHRGIVFDGGFDILLGPGNIGAFKLGLDFDKVSLNSGKNEADGADPEEFAYSDGKLLIALGWGRNFELGGGTLAPEFSIGYQISTFKVEQKGTDAFSYVRYYDFDAGRWVDDDYFEKMGHFQLGLGAEYTSPSEAHWFGLEYGLDIGVHPSTIEKIGGESISWKGYWVGNGLAVSYKRSVELNERFSLNLGANLGLGLVNARVDYTGLPDPYDGIEFSVNPDVGIAVAYAFAKRPFTLYSGIGLSSLDSDGDGENDPFYSVVYANDNADPATETYTHTFVPWGLSAGLGLNFAPFENFTLGLNLSQNLSYYVSDKLEYVWAWNIFDWSDHPFTAAIQATFKF